MDILCGIILWNNTDSIFADDQSKYYRDLPLISSLPAAVCVPICDERSESFTAFYVLHYMYIVYTYTI